MVGLTKPKLKICGMKYPDNIEEVMVLNPDYLGFIFYRSSRRYIDSLSADFVKNITQVKKVGVFVNDTVSSIQKAITDYGLDLIQLHGDEDPAFTAEIKGFDVEVVKAFGISSGFDWKQIVPYKEMADYYLFDTKTEHYGGSGERFNWRLLDQYEQDTPYFLSGGLGPANIDEIAHLHDTRLYAIDLNSKFESSPGRKDIGLLKSIFSEG